MVCPTRLSQIIRDFRELFVFYAVSILKYFAVIVSLDTKTPFLIFKLSLQEIGRNIIHLIQTKPNPIHESEDWPGPVTLGNPKPLDCNMCGLVGRALGTTVFLKFRQP